MISFIDTKRSHSSYDTLRFSDDLSFHEVSLVKLSSSAENLRSALIRPIRKWYPVKSADY